MIKIVFAILGIFGIADVFVLYCSLIQGKREDEVLEKLNHKKEKNIQKRETLEYEKEWDYNGKF